MRIALSCVKGLGIGFYIPTTDGASNMCDMSFNEDLLKKGLVGTLRVPKHLNVKVLVIYNFPEHLYRKILLHVFMKSNSLKTPVA